MNEFIQYLENEKNKAPNTIVAYGRDIRAFDRYLRSRDVESLLDCRENDAVSYVMDLGKKKKSASTINRKISSLRLYFDFYKDRGEIDVNPFDDIKTAKPETREIEFLTVEEIEQLLSLPDNSHKGYRDRALLEFMYGTGARVTEVVKLRFSDINFKMNFVMTSDGTEEKRIIPLGKYCKKALIEYIDNAYNAVKGDVRLPDDYVFINFRGSPLTRQGIWKILKEYGEIMGIKDKMTPQTLRNSFAVHILQNGGDLKSLSELMGFDDISAGMAYLSVIKVRVRDVYNKSHPRA